MGSILQESKLTLRIEMRARLAALSEEYRKTASEQAGALLGKQPVWQHAKSVLCYAPLDHELNVWPMVGSARQAGKTVALPRFDVDKGEYVACEVKDLSLDVEPGRYGVREPRKTCVLLRLNRLDLVLVPGLAFDLHGHRLGRGKGFYDRLLMTVGGKTCGVAFDEQIVRDVPVEPHDSDVNCILTPTRWIEL